MPFKDNLEKELKKIIADGQTEAVELLEILRNKGIPTLKDEHWKYTPLNFLYKNDYNFGVVSAQSDFSIDDIISGLYVPENSQILVLFNGSIIREEITNRENIQINISELNNVPIVNTDENRITSNIFENINGVFRSEQISINLKSVSAPLLLVNISNGENIFANSAININCFENSVSEVFRYNVNIGENNFSNHKIEINIASGAKLNIYDINNSANNYSVNNFNIKQAEDSDLSYYSMIFQSKFLRNNFNVNLNGRGIESKLSGLFIGKKASIVDNHILMSHNQSNCHSNQFFKGIIEDTSRGVFNGKVLVRKDAQKTDAYQSNKNILTTKEATIFTKPELEIYADDVKCSHGATSGFLQDNELFYLLSRGISKDVAKSLLLKAFANEVLDKIENTGFNSWLHSNLDNVI